MSPRLAASFALLVALASCEPLPLGDGPRRVVVRQLAADVIVPSYDDVATRTATLKSAVLTLTAAPSAANLTAAQSAWRTARAPWMESQAFGFGPVTDLLLDAQIDQAIDPARIDAELAAATPLDVPALGANKKGFRALEYLLFAPDALPALQSSARRRDYLGALAIDLAARTEELRDAWTSGPTPYLDVFTSTPVKDAIDTIVNQTSFLTELLDDAELTDASLADAAAGVRGLRVVWTGSRTGALAPDLGLRSLIFARSPSAALRIDAELDAADAALASNTLDAADAALHELRLSFSVDVIALLGATLSFNANDGD